MLPVPRRTMMEGIRDIVAVAIERDPNLVVSGEDIGNRCFDAPMPELGIVGAAVGMAAYGLLFKHCPEWAPSAGV